MHIKQGDTVIVRSGKDRGKKGKVIKVFSRDRRIVVEGVHLVKRRQRPRKSGEKGQTIQRPLPIDASNALTICGQCGKAGRAARTIIDQKKVRVCRKCRSPL